MGPWSTWSRCWLIRGRRTLADSGKGLLSGSQGACQESRADRARTLAADKRCDSLEYGGPCMTIGKGVWLNHSAERSAYGEVLLHYAPLLHTVYETGA